MSNGFKRVAAELQEDYLQAYLDFYSDKPSIAPTIIEKYQNYPVLKWKKRFLEVKSSLKEYLFVEKLLYLIRAFNFYCSIWMKIPKEPKLI